jgi:hypothetical protein
MLSFYETADSNGTETFFGLIPIFTIVASPSPMAIPEPSTVTLAAAGLALLWPLRRWRRRTAGPRLAGEKCLIVFQRSSD